jgi:Zn-dependent protease with chaperone function
VSWQSVLFEIEKMKFIRFVVLFVLLCVIASGQSNSYEAEINVGRSYRNKLLLDRPELKDTPETEVAQQVFRNLLATGIAQSWPRFPFRLTFFDSHGISASSTAGGEVFAEGGLVKLLKDSPGLWAAILGHEIAHTRLSHHFKAILRQLSLQEQKVLREQSSTGNQNPLWALIGLNIGGELLNLKPSSDEEYEADRVGLFMMAEAGYHPDFALSCYRRLAFKSGDQSKETAFFSAHPRWETREEKAWKAYDKAMGIFTSKWPDAAKSPGGLAPAIANVGNVRVVSDKTKKAVVITVPITVRNVAEGALQANLYFLHKGQNVPSAMEEYAVGRHKSLGRIISWKPNYRDELSECEFVIPSAALAIKQRRLRGVIQIFGPDMELIHNGVEFDVSFPVVKK